MAHSLLEGKRFFCREWVFSKILHCLETLQRKVDEDGAGLNNGRNGILIVGGPGAGKTACCSEIVHPTMEHGKQLHLRKRLLAHHFCQSHDLNTLSLAEFIYQICIQLVKSPLVEGYGEKICEEDLCLKSIAEDPDAAFKKLIIFPLLELDSPPQACFLLVDSIDESYNTSQLPCNSSSCKGSFSNTISELLGYHCHLLPSWLVLVCTARKQSKYIGKLFSGFRKIGLDDLRKSQVIRDVQQYILSRLDQDFALRQHIRRETAEMLNQLHIKSNGCFLYLEKVLDGISENFIVLREIREIPGTLYGLYLWLCQRLFTKKQFSKVQPILCILLVSRQPMKESEILACLTARHPAITKEDFAKRMHVLRRVLIKSPNDGYQFLFHHSFSEWFLDVKYCTQKYLCQSYEGHVMKVMWLASRASELRTEEVADLAYHLSHSTKLFGDLNTQVPVFLLSLGITVFGEEFNLHAFDVKVVKLLAACGVTKQTVRNVGGSERLGSSGNVVTSKAFLDGVEDHLHHPRLPTRNGSDTCLDEGGGEAPCENSEDLAAALSGSVQITGDDSLETGEDGLAKVDVVGDINQVDYNQRTPLHNAANDGNLAVVQFLIGHNVSLEAVDRHGRTALNLAARQGHAAVLNELLKVGADVDHADSDGWTPLRSAAWAGHVDVVDLLLSQSAQVDLTDGDGRTALRAAAWGGHEEVVNSLIKAGASPSLPDSEGRTPLIAAAYMGHAEIVERLLNAGADVNHADSDGRTALSVAALCVAASQGHLKVVNLLLERNAEVDHQDRDGTTPLLVAAFEGHKEVCELLLEYEADVDAVDKAGRTPLWAAASMGHAAVCELLLFWGAYVDHIDGEGRTVLSVAAAQGNVSVVRLLLARGLDEGHRDNAGWTPLHYSSFEGHQEVTEVLVESGARLNETDNDGKHALLLSAQEGHIHVVEALLNLGAVIDQRSHDGRTALRAAAIEGYRDIVQLLVSRGSDVNYRDADGRSTLYLLSLENRVAMAQFLIRCGADVEARDVEGRTPLHVSAWQGHLEMVELLVSGGAEVNAVDNDRRTPLQSASWQGHSGIVRLLCERGSKIDHTCNQGATALCIAAQEGHLECVRALLEWGANPVHSDRCGRTPIRVAMKSGHVSISKLLEEIALARSKTMLAKGLNVADWEGIVQRGEGLDQSKPSSSNLPPSYYSGTTGGGVNSTDNPTCGTTESSSSHFLTQGTTPPDVEKRRSITSIVGGILGSGAPNNMTTSTKSSHNSNSEQSHGSPAMLSRQDHRSRRSNSGSGSNHHNNNNNNESSSKQSGLSFTQQVQQLSRMKGRPGSRLLSPLNEPQSPIYASPPQSPSSDSVNDDRVSPHGPFSRSDGIGGSHNSGDFSGVDIGLGVGGGKSGSPLMSNGCSVQPFAFTRDSHMKIILGNSTSENTGNGKSSRKNGLSYNANSSIISATSAIRSGLTALKAGVLEAAVGRKGQQDDSPLVSAASMAVPNLVRKKPVKSEGNGIIPWKRETPL